MKFKKVISSILVAITIFSTSLPISIYADDTYSPPPNIFNTMSDTSNVFNTMNAFDSSAINTLNSPDFFTQQIQQNAIPQTPQTPQTQNISKEGRVRFVNNKYILATNGGNYVLVPTNNDIQASLPILAQYNVMVIIDGTMENGDVIKITNVTIIDPQVTQEFINKLQQAIQQSKTNSSQSQQGTASGRIERIDSNYVLITPQQNYILSPTNNEITASFPVLAQYKTMIEVQGTLENNQIIKVTKVTVTESTVTQDFINKLTQAVQGVSSTQQTQTPSNTQQTQTPSNTQQTQIPQMPTNLFSQMPTNLFGNQNAQMPTNLLNNQNTQNSFTSLFSGTNPWGNLNTNTNLNTANLFQQLQQSMGSQTSATNSPLSNFSFNNLFQGLSNTPINNQTSGNTSLFNLGGQNSSNLFNLGTMPIMNTSNMPSMSNIDFNSMLSNLQNMKSSINMPTIQTNTNTGTNNTNNSN